MTYHWQTLLSAQAAENDQWKTIMRKIGRTHIGQAVDDKTYTTTLKSLTGKTQKLHIPLLRHPMSDYTRCFVLNLQKKINQHSSYTPELCPLEIMVLYHLINVLDEGFYHKGTSIVELYRMFQEVGNRESLRQIQLEHSICPPARSNESLLSDHDECLKRVRCVFGKFRELQGSTNQFQYKCNVKVRSSDLLKPVHLKSVAYNEKLVIVFCLQPTVSPINFYDLVHQCMIDTFLLARDWKKENNGVFRYRGKQILTCIITLMEEQAPFFIDFESAGMLEQVQGVLTNSVLKKCTNYHQQIFSYYDNVCRKRTDSLHNLAEQLLSTHPPTYIRTWLEDILSQMRLSFDDVLFYFNDERRVLSDMENRALAYWNNSICI